MSNEELAQQIQAGRNKSSILNIIAGPDWFSDSMVTFEGKNAFEAVTGKWLIEIPEMHTFDKVTMNQAKAFITKQSDFYRAAYAEFPEERPRQCVFFGTTNEGECLSDRTGGRRFWPLDIDAVPRTKILLDDLPRERDQLWAEAFVRWKAGEQLYLPQDLEAVAKGVQEDHRERSAWEGIIHEFMERQVPEDWSKWPLDRRRMYWGNPALGGNKPKLVPRDRICALEVWCEAFGGDIKALKRSDAAEINAIITRTKGWRKSAKVMRSGPYGVQRGFDKM